MKRTLTLYIFFLASSIPLLAQTIIDTAYFRSPVKHRIVLAGSFGELRPNHFHAGIDIKPSSKKVDTIYAAADGYVSRIRTNRAGYGQAAYIDHPNGYSTVYAHLKIFLGQVGEEVLKMQKSVESYEVDFYPSPGLVMVKKGQPIGLMGNTGRSYGPHLHFEVRETETEIPVNPFSFGVKPTDSKPPSIYSVTLHGLTSKYQKTWDQYLPTKSFDASHYAPITAKIPASKAGIAVHSFDKMDRADNYNGIYQLQMWVDGELAYDFSIDKISFDETRMINAHIDYATKKIQNRTDILCYQLPGNQLNFINKELSGIIDLYFDRSREVKIKVKDFENNENNLTLYLTKAEELAALDQSYNFMIGADSMKSLQVYGHKLRFPHGSLIRDLALKVDYEDGILVFGRDSDPLLKSVDVKIKVPLGLDTSKLIFGTRDDKGRWVDYGGSFVNGIYTGKLGKFGDYEWYEDRVEPTIEVGTFKLTVPKSQKTVSFLIDDNVIAKGAGAEWSYDVWIDGVWQAAKYKDMTRVLTVDLSAIAAGSHSIKVKVADARGNSNTYIRDFQRL